ncbi:MAG TPA: 50S ribosomal protein L35 [Gemmatimonadales bacterium]|jgi:large subunit ribosomal protein L35
MPKKKTKKAAAKRFKMTANGRIKRGHAFKRHILTKKHPDRKRRLRSGTLVANADTRNITRLLST